MRKKTPQGNTPEQATIQNHCRDCAHSYDWHSPALDGHLILCRCKFDAKSEHGKWCKFLDDPACDQYKPTD